MLSQDEAWLLKEKHGGEKSAAFFADCERMKQEEPLAYILGDIPFLNATIKLDARPFIPRSCTESWTEHAINMIKLRGPAESRVLDLCAGSGAIGIGVLKNLPESTVVFGEINATHIQTIKDNLQHNEISANRYTVLQTDLFSNISGTFDYILSNPPYVDPVLDRTDYSVKNFEPHLALYGGELGFELIKKIIEAAPQHLTSGSQLWLEHEPEQVALIHAAGAKYGFTDINTHQDNVGTERYTVLVLQ